MVDTIPTTEATDAVVPGGKLELTVDNAREVLKQVDDPELGVNVVDLGLIYEIHVRDEKNVQVIMTLTTPFCPVGPSIKQQISQVISRDLDGVGKVDVQFTFNPPWDKDMMSEDAKAELGIF